MGRPPSGDGRTVVINLYIKPSVKRELTKMSKATGYSMAIIADAVLDKFLTLAKEEDVKDVVANWNKAHVIRSK